MSNLTDFLTLPCVVVAVVKATGMLGMLSLICNV